MQPRRQTSASSSSLSRTSNGRRRSLDPHALRSRYAPRHGDDEVEEDDAGAGHQQSRPKSIMTFPCHPLPSMQGPFEESMLDATGETGHVPYAATSSNVKARQKMLCREVNVPESAWNFTYTSHWRLYPRGKYHPLRKIAAQIIFGVHLLHQRLEKSVADVADILLKHVNELDQFLQRANEDIEESMKDMLFRKKCLKVPMEHVKEFDRLLEDRNYRAQLLDGNITIERTITRMSLMLNDYLMDMSTFREANAELDGFLLDIGDAWTSIDDDVGRIYSAMCGNTSGWSQFLQSLVAKTEKLGVVLVQVSSYCNEIEKRCGAASRRSLIASRSSSRNSSNSRDTSRAQSFRNFANNKPLPTVPTERSPFRSSPVAKDSALRLDTDVRRTRGRSPSGTTNSKGVELQPESPYEDSFSTPTSHMSPARAEPRSPMHVQRYPEEIRTASRRQSQLSPLGRGNSDATIRQNMSKSKAHSTCSDEKEVVMLVDGSKLHGSHPSVGSQPDFYSPAFTGKDSAYSSLSGGSFATPNLAQPRSMSSLSSHARTLRGFFPRSSPGTPALSSPRSYHNGEASPEMTAPYPPSDPLYVPPRAHTAQESHGHMGRKLPRKSSLSSLKKFFGRKKIGSFETVVE